jgi:transcriptional regulator with XRE-family HTH domain
MPTTHPLATYCRDRGIRLNRIAKELHVQHSTIWRLVHFERNPSGALAQRIAEVTNGAVSVAALIEAHFGPDSPNVTRAAGERKASSVDGEENDDAILGVCHGNSTVGSAAG